MKDNVVIKDVIEGVLACQRKNGHTESYLINLSYLFKRLLKHAKSLGTEYLTKELIDLFLADTNNSYTGEYTHNRFLAHNRCIRFLESFIETGKVYIKKYQKPVQEQISDGFYESLALFTQKEKVSGLSQASLEKNHRPIRYLLEFMTSLGYRRLEDIQHGDTIAAIEDMLEKHYDPSSLTTAISGMRRFYEMFPVLHPYRMEIPSRLLRKRPIIDVYTEKEQEQISALLSSSKISRRNAAICLLSFETGLRSVDICNLKLNDVDWKNSIIYIVQSKTKKPLNLPIRSTYGNAMVEYILNERPESNENYLFLSEKAPFVKLKTTWHIIKSVVIAAGVETSDRITGTRMFRHNVASTMLRKGVPLSVISEELGHGNQDSTMVYITTDQKTMSSLTLPLPIGGDRK